MSRYSAHISITIPASLYDVGCAIARAMDPDVGGHLSYGPRMRVDAEGDEYQPESYTTSFPCTEEFAAQARYLLATPPALHAAVSADYGARWADLEPPNLEQCEAFCAGAELNASHSVADVSV
jgi:hypothetical protein